MLFDNLSLGSSFGTENTFRVAKIYCGISMAFGEGMAGIYPRAILASEHT
jgi:hypothetical protein